MPAGNVDYDALLSTTLKKYLPKLEDNIFSARPLVYFLKQADNMKKQSGGAKIVVPLMYGQNSTAGSYSGYDLLDTTPQEGITAAEYDWKQYSVSVTISGIEEAKNNGEAAVLDLLEAKVMQAEETVNEQWDIMFHDDGTGNGGKDWNGLGNLIGAGGTIGGIDATDAANDWWRSTVEGTAGVLDTADMTHAYNTASVGADQPKAILTSQELFEKYESLLQPNIRYTDTKTADAGFQNLMFKGAPVTYDVYTPAGTVYFLNPKYIKLIGHSDVWFKPTPFVRPNNQDARYSQILSYGNLVVSNRKRQAVLTGRTG